MTCKNFNAEIISIGDEITSGALIETNSSWLSADLAEQGIRTLYHSTIGDEMTPMINAFRLAAQRSDLIAITGGIGPTEDDLTRQAVAEAFDRPLVYFADIFEHIRQHFEKRKRFMPDSNRIQAYFPQGTTIINNPHGTAPGFCLDADRTEFGLGSGRFRLMVFPGVPAEMKEMWNATGRQLAIDLEKSIVGRSHFVLSHRLQCFGLGESELEAKLPHLIARDHIPAVGITVKEGIMTLRIRAEGDSAEECRGQIEQTRSLVYEILGDIVFGEEDETLAGVVCEKLRKKNAKAAIMEWGTRGLLTARLTPDIFRGARIFSEKDPFVRQDLALNARAFAEKLQADYVLIVGPYPDSSANSSMENSDVIIGVYEKSTDRLTLKEITFGGHPSMIDSLFGSRILDLTRHIL